MILSFLSNWFSFPDGSVLTNLLASALWVPLTYMVALRHLHCSEKGCYRPGTVPVSGTQHKMCKRHASRNGHTH